jgi:hypothetical protein
MLQVSYPWQSDVTMWMGCAIQSHSLCCKCRTNIAGKWSSVAQGESAKLRHYTALQCPVVSVLKKCVLLHKFLFPFRFQLTFYWFVLQKEYLVSDSCSTTQYICQFQCLMICSPVNPFNSSCTILHSRVVDTGAGSLLSDMLNPRHAKMYVFILH